MMDCPRTRKNESGFSLIELLVAMVILAVLATVAIPTFSVWLPDYRLKRAARDLYSNLQRAKLGAVNANETWGVFFDNGVTPGRYSIWSLGPNRTWDSGGGDDVLQNIRVSLSEYEGVDYGSGNAPTNVQGNPFGPVITYVTPNNVAIFTSRGTVNNMGYVYLSNPRGSAYAVGTPSPAGVIVMKKYTGGGWE